jgi:hypothetical protein
MKWVREVFASVRFALQECYRYLAVALLINERHFVVKRKLLGIFPARHS